MKPPLSYPPFTGWWRLACTLLAGGLLYASLYFVNPAWFEDDYYVVYGPWAYLMDLSAWVVGCYGLAEFSIWFARLLDRFLPWQAHPLRRLGVQVIALTVLGMAFILLLIELISFLTTPANYQYSPQDQTLMRYTLLVGGMALLGFNALYTGGFFFRQWRSALLEAEQYKRASLVAQLEALQAQINPHFLFNNLTTLTSLIEEDPPQAIDYVDKLAQVYRYVLQVRHYDVVPLSQELAFIEAYLYLALIRFGTSLRVELDLPGSADQVRIPPMTLQLLVENALKHNVATPQRPLRIRLERTAANWLVIRNSWQPKPPANNPASSSTGMGLENIHHRYRLLGEPLPRVEQTPTEFIVSLPLL